MKWRQILLDTTKHGHVFSFLPPKFGYHHLFLDGSCFNDEYPMLNLAAWGVINATMGDIVTAAPVAGLAQSIDRAELMAVVASLQWAAGTELGLCLWSDSLSTVNTMEYVLQHGLFQMG